MIKITQTERDALDRAGLLQYRHRNKGGGMTDANFTVVNRQSNSRNKHYYVVESPEVLTFLEKYDNMNLQNIRAEQLQALIEQGCITQDNIQHYGEYKPEATVYIDREGKIRCKKITEYMLAMGIWKK